MQWVRMVYTWVWIIECQDTWGPATRLVATLAVYIKKMFSSCVLLDTCPHCYTVMLTLVINLHISDSIMIHKYNWIGEAKGDF
jgi:hypothetical protein